MGGCVSPGRAILCPGQPWIPGLEKLLLQERRAQGMAGLEDCLTAPPLEREAEPFHVGVVSTITGKFCIGIPAYLQ